MTLAREFSMIPSAETKGNCRFSRRRCCDEFVDVDRRDIRLVGAGSADGLWHLSGALPDLLDACDVGGKARRDGQREGQRRKLRPPQAISAAVLNWWKVGWTAAVSAA